MARPKKISEPKKRGYGNGTLMLIGKVWYLKWMHNGKVFKKSMRTTDREEAERKADSEILPFKTDSEIEALEIVKAKIATKAQQKETDEYDKRRVRWDSVIDSYFDRGFSDGSTDESKLSYENTFERLNKWVKSKNYVITYMDEFTIDMAEEYRRYLSEKFSDSTYNSSLCLFSWLWKRLEAKTNPWEHFKKRNITISSRRDLTFDEVKKILDYVKDNEKLSHHEEFYTLILIGLYTGLRLRDCCHLKWSQVDLKRKLISLIPHKTKKTLREVNIPMFPVLEEQLTKIKSSTNDEHIMPHILYEYEHKSIERRLRDMFKACGIKTSERLPNGSYKSIVSFHSFRYTFTKMMSALHCPQNQVQKMLAHATPRMTSRYYKDDIAVAQRYVSALPSFDSIDREEQTEIMIDKSVVETIDRRRGELSISEYIRKLIRLEINAVDMIEAKAKLEELKRKKDEELNRMLDEVMGESK